MASVAHCLYCFESLAAHLESRRSMSLKEVDELWSEYCKSAEIDTEGTAIDDSHSSQSATSKIGSRLKKRIPALSRVVNAGTSSSSLSTPSSGSGSTSTMSLDVDTPETSTSSLLAASQPATLTESPLFVTWNKVSSHTGNTALRGCIGTFESQDLDEGLSSYAVISAVQDLRFSPVTRRELPSLEVAVTLLTDFEDCDDAMDWELGTHGLRISFTDRGRRYGATYLPDVAPEQGWDKEETILSLMRKAGWVGRKDKWSDVDLKVVRYQGRKIDLQYPEYKHWRDWVDEKKKA